MPESASQPDMTAHWEMQLNQISKKEASYQQFMFELNSKLPHLLQSPNRQILQNLAKITPLANQAKSRYFKKRSRTVEN